MNWIKMTAHLDTKPEVMMLADILGVHELHVVGLLWKLWTWLDQNAEDCNGVSVTRALLDRVTCNGMAVALTKVGWLKGDDGALDFPNFDRHNGETAKKRAVTAKRVNKFRGAQGVTQVKRESNANCNAASVTREEKRREEKNNTPLPPSGEFEKFWQAYPKRKGKGNAIRAWQRAIKLASAETIIAAVHANKRGQDWLKENGKFIPHPASWLNAQGWLDEIKEPERKY